MSLKGVRFQIVKVVNYIWFQMCMPRSNGINSAPLQRGVDPAAQLDAMMREGGPEIDLSGGLAPDGAAADLLRGMFQPAPHRRLRVDLPAPGDGTSIKRHPFFLRNLSSWGELERRTLTPPFVPSGGGAEEEQGEQAYGGGGGGFFDEKQSTSEDVKRPFESDFEAMKRLHRTGHTRNLVDAAVV